MEHYRRDEYLPIEDYGIIGNLHTTALVSVHGSIDYLPFTRIDSPTIFLQILDCKIGGYFSIAPYKGFINSRQFYLNKTNILVTRFHTETGVVEVIDLMPVNEQEFNCAIVRKVRSVIGTVEMKMECKPAFDYARATHTIKQIDEGVFFQPNSNETPICLSSDVPIEIKDELVVAHFTIKENETYHFLLEADGSEQQRTNGLVEYIDTAYSTTYHFWKQWVSKIKYHGEWQDHVIRSALVLKLLISQKYGSPVAAATFGLPEAIGGERNWDYRYTWIRDAAFTMYAFMELGLYDEADKFIAWIIRQEKNQKLQLLYGVDGTKELPEQTLDHLDGYKQSRPVRIGNKAYAQIQIDIYGELLDTVYIFVKGARRITPEFWNEIVEQINITIENWRNPDHSIWEIRGEKKEFLFTRVMCWVALDRAIRIAEICSFAYPLLEWRQVRDEIYKDIFDNFWDEELQSFVQYKGSKKVDASMLLMPIINFISPYSSYWQGTIKAIEKELVSDVLVYRYHATNHELDKLKGTEGTFTICSFWYVECLALAGETEKARMKFERLLTYSNAVGLYAEQIGRRGDHLGNFPQAFTHLSLINTAIELNKEMHLKKKIVPPDNKPGKLH